MIDVDAGEGTSNQQPNDNAIRSEPPTFRDALKKIRFLLLTPKQFAESVPRTNLLSTTESFAILMNISSTDIHPMPEGFSTCIKSRSITQPPPQSNSNIANVNPFYHENSNDGHHLFPLAASSAHEPMPFMGHSSSIGSFHVRSRNPTNRYKEQHAQPGRDLMDVTETRRFYCVRPIRAQIEYFNTSVSDCALTFTVVTCTQ